MSQLVEVQPNMAISMEYQDADGVVTERPILLQQVELGENNHLYLRGYCLLRNDHRTFRAGRIRSICREGVAATDVVSFLEKTGLVDFGNETKTAQPTRTQGDFAKPHAHAAQKSSTTNPMPIIIFLMIVGGIGAWVFAQIGWGGVIAVFIVLGVISLFR